MTDPLKPRKPGSHTPIMVAEILRGLNIEADSTIVDGTFGGGGHSLAICQKLGPTGRLIAIDRDIEAVERARQLARKVDTQIEAVHASYAELPDILDRLSIGSVDGILLDLGLSSIQLDDAARGFSFMVEGALDMRFDTTRGETAAQLIKRLPERELADLIYEYGEERRSRRIARVIVAERQQRTIETTSELADIVSRAVGGRRGARIHPATQTFQALRIAVNDELGELRRGLLAGIDAVHPGGRFAVIAFHSLEDRLVKRLFTDEVRGCICPPEQPICTCGREQRVRWIERLVKPSDDEISENPRSRSARLRIVERL